MPDSTATSRVTLIAQRDGGEVSAELAFAAGALRLMGRDVSPLLVDFSSTESAVAEAVASGQGDVLIVSTLEGREMDLLLASRARAATRGKVVLAGDALSRCPLFPGALDSGVVQASAITTTALAPFFSSTSAHRSGPERIGADFTALGGASLLRRTLGGSFFGEVGEIPILATRPARDRVSPVAELARFEAPLNVETVLLPAPALSTLRDLADDGRSVAFWDRDLPDALWPLVEACGARELGISVRLAPDRALPERLSVLRSYGVTRIVMDCDAHSEQRLPGSIGSAEDIARAASCVHGLNMEVGVFLVAGLPGETTRIMQARIDFLRAARIDRVRVVPFEPTGGTPAWHACIALGVWPPIGELWNREVYRPIRQPEAARDMWTEIESTALHYLAEVDVVYRGKR